ncbi:MAG TPA: acetyl-CoA carboxylase biotin carboxylase subunit, partial [Bacteroidetes bacterium]|nr:acetyl-CoA carboxylase biotin carboxylase subunit [Bacteroidota bacterium]
PSPGEITSWHTPKGYGVRVDTHAHSMYRVPPYYDSMIAKVIVRAKSRKEAINRMKRALNEFVVEGIHTTIPLHL